MSERPAGLLERSGEHFLPAGGIEKRDIDGVLHKGRDAASLSGCDQGANLHKLLIGQRDGDFCGRHTIYHTAGLG